MLTQKKTVLFLCTKNSARSQIAEALLRHLANDAFEAYSAGLNPTDVHPMAIQVLREVGIQTDGLYSKPVSTFLGKIRVNFAIVLCEDFEKLCPRIYPFAIDVLSWPLDDPIVAKKTDLELLQAFRKVRDELESRLIRWLANEKKQT